MEIVVYKLYEIGNTLLVAIVFMIAATIITTTPI